MEARFKTLKDFYPFYLSEHKNPTSRKLHFIGTALLFVILGVAIYLGRFGLLWLIPIVGYGFAWVGIFSLKKTNLPHSNILYTVWPPILSCFSNC